MFCPKCKIEYRDGFTICNDCQTPLLEEETPVEIPSRPQLHQEPLDFKILITVFDSGTVALIHSVFDEAKISYFMQGEESMLLRPGIPVLVMVREDQVEEAQEILKELL